jgi:hypothetical protein
MALRTSLAAGVPFQKRFLKLTDMTHGSVQLVTLAAITNLSNMTLGSVQLVTLAKSINYAAYDAINRCKRPTTAVSNFCLSRPSFTQHKL